MANRAPLRLKVWSFRFPDLILASWQEMQIAGVWISR